MQEPPVVAPNAPGDTALVLLSEIGLDVSRFPTVKHFTSWLGLCPQHRGSAGKIRS
jgi:transposase